MKKLLIPIIFLFACGNEHVQEDHAHIKINGAWFRLYTIDSCEYYGYDVGGRTGILTHKGNCKHCQRK